MTSAHPCAVSILVISRLGTFGTLERFKQLPNFINQPLLRVLKSINQDFPPDCPLFL